MIKRFWNWLWGSSTKPWAVIFVVGGLAGIGFTASLNAFFDYTNRTEFCISCHEMRDQVYQEWRKSIHYKNQSGVKAECKDCHVPKEFWPKVARKIGAWRDVYGTLTGIVDTPEKFEAMRLDMAERVWAYMRDSNSRECLSCHAYEDMDFHKQKRRAAEKMQEAMKKNPPAGEACIECHKGIAHKKPRGDDEDEDEDD